ncbi:diguanylate cyclase [Curvibacter sp. APW13]|uniref:diguanylate cyclase n=1 Tax=Curvibacter sp. APW13 TaxID=3077236 RepID=UPI0028DEDCA3|nr:diguanylate cyclase [Curvibacter sp. APW13]MDT8990086.1 diguanylate cyclase [Curvibacter sp. APW13]
MELFETIHQQSQAMRLPLWGVSLTAVPCPNTPVLLALHWFGFASAGVSPREASVPVPGSALQINDPWQNMAQLDDGMLDAAWRLGAWDLLRQERRSCSTAGASEREALDCRQAFADDSLHEDPDALMVRDAPDREELMRLGERVGYVRWYFRPVRDGIWNGIALDETLGSDGGREPPCPVGVQPAVGTRLQETRYRLGRQTRIYLG